MMNFHFCMRKEAFSKYLLLGLERKSLLFSSFSVCCFYPNVFHHSVAALSLLSSIVTVSQTLLPVSE